MWFMPSNHTSLQGLTDGFNFFFGGGTAELLPDGLPEGAQICGHMNNSSLVMVIHELVSVCPVWQDVPGTLGSFIYATNSKILARRSTLEIMGSRAPGFDNPHKNT
ncbi:hypothetical protein AVEN_195328-1 [Araneus ventricosus]|uniref:Uncharacterized protein n=1 Tax=Araneus ventricosus TaxID=182803 RepID=A0A4Y2S852_ARAVE|nr:hypothetical protein AVEN_195328-1 [Araneus ventricosus]